MLIEIGHTAALDEHGNDLEGERITSFVVPDGLGVSEVMASVIDAIGSHIDLRDSPPAWVRANNPVIQNMLISHLRMDPKRNSRPKSWGKAHK